MLPFLTVIVQASGVILDKVILTRRQMPVRIYIPVLFFLLFLTTVIFFPWLGKVSPKIFESRYLVLFLGMVVTGIIWNFYYYKGVQAEKVQDFELILMFQPLLTIILASILLKGESNLSVQIAALIAAAALIIAQIKKHHFTLSRGSFLMIMAVIFMSIELIIIRLLLDVLSPVALYTIRTAILFIFFQLYYRPDILRISNKNAGLILLTSALGTIQMVSKFYGFTEYGVVYTSLILILSPLLVYMFSTIFLHERLKTRTVACGIVILMCIIYATLLA